MPNCARNGSPPTGRKPWIPFWECLIYCPVFVFPIALFVSPFLEQFDGLGKWCASAIESRNALALVMLTVGIWYILEPLLQGFWYLFAGVSGSEQIEHTGKTLVSNIVNRQDVNEQIKELQPWVQEWNFDWAHFEARLWYWLAVRYAANAEAEREVESSLREYVAMINRKGHSCGFSNQYLAWHLRAEAKLRSLPNGTRLMPPQLQLP